MQVLGLKTMLFPCFIKLKHNKKHGAKLFFVLYVFAKTKKLWLLGEIDLQESNHVVSAALGGEEGIDESYEIAFLLNCCIEIPTSTPLNQIFFGPDKIDTNPIKKEYG